MAWLGAIVTALMTAGEIAHNDACVVKSRDNFFGGGMCDLFNVTIVTVSLSTADCHGVFLVGSKEGLYAETKLICLFAKLLVFAPVVGRLDMYRTKVLLYRTMVLMARLTKVRR